MEINIITYKIESKLNSIKKDLKEIEKTFKELKNGDVRNIKDNNN